MKIVCFSKSFRSSIEGVGNVWVFREVLSAKVSQYEALKKMMFDSFFIDTTKMAQRIVFSTYTLITAFTVCFSPPKFTL